ncbi:hypothetical protein [Psychrobacillus sp. FSL H8-0487]|uniref:hypothetical protein n=1 Tax=Psychrobacillus sp. FSL H8-0487 TaxID=2921391 RepID=UPI0030F8E668
MTKSPTLLEAIEFTPGGGALLGVIKETMRLTGLTKEEISERLEPYTDIILRESPLTDEEIKEITAVLLKKNK